jgi:hypothetical protein
LKCPICNDVFTILNNETGILEICECVPEEQWNIDLNNVEEEDNEQYTKK